ncbi:hypothetical protein QYF36_013867 [Acer negundo]|nr:hypothetical protein QYF36_013867 [Acer negundo]
MDVLGCERPIEASSLVRPTQRGSNHGNYIKEPKGQQNRTRAAEARTSTQNKQAKTGRKQQTPKKKTKHKQPNTGKTRNRVCTQATQTGRNTKPATARENANLSSNPPYQKETEKPS